MIYFSIDIETTGIDWNQDTILEFGVILEDTDKQLPFEELPKFSCLLRHPKYIGDPFALAMHKEIFIELSKPDGESEETIIDHDKLGEKFYYWLIEQNRKSETKFLIKAPLNEGVIMEYNFQLPIMITVAGKNFGTFDARFLENLEGFSKFIKFHQRVIDPAALYFDNNKDKQMPNLSTCKERAGLSDTRIAHRTIQDAWDIIQVLRKRMYSK